MYRDFIASLVNIYNDVSSIKPLDCSNMPTALAAKGKSPWVGGENKTCHHIIIVPRTKLSMNLSKTCA